MALERSPVPSVGLSAAALEARVLLLPPTRRDADAIQRLLGESGIACVVCPTMASLCHETALGAAVVLVSEEALVGEPHQFASVSARQPVWSDIPTIVLSRSGTESPKLAAHLAEARNVTVLERPVRLSTFLSVVRSSIRGRFRQYEVRTHLAHIEAADQERRALLESERVARTEAEHASRMKDEFLATLSHEIRTPLNAILGWTHILAHHRNSTEDIAKGLAVIERNARAQSQIIADLLDMNRIVNGKVRLDVQSIGLTPILQAAVDTITPAADAKGVHLEAHLDPFAGPVSGDPGRLQQVFWNLLSNAVKFTPRGGRVEVLLRRIDAHVEVRVADTGEGISPGFLPYVFDRFRQADGSTTRRHGGLGLGLAIVKQIVELHGGSVSAMSAGPGQGSTFTVLLPSRADDRRPVHEACPASAVAGAVSGRKQDDLAGIKVLVVDDEADCSELVRRLLEDRGASVTVASSAREAFELLRGTRPDVLISDIGMPGEDGYTLIRRIRALDAAHGGQTAAIGLTAYARPEDRVSALGAGFQHHVTKPLDAIELIATVASLVPRTPAAKGSDGATSRP